MIESGYLTSLRKALKGRVYYLKNTHAYSSGVADVWLSGSRLDFWVEAKYAQKLPPVLNLTDTRYWCSALQQDWLVNRHKEGRNVGVLCGSPNGAVWFPGLSWQIPMAREEFKRLAKKTIQVAEMLTELVGQI